MFTNFFYFLRQHQLKVTLREHLTLLEALDKDVIRYSVDDFYALSRAVYVKHEKDLDRFDVLFGNFFQHLDQIPVDKIFEIPVEWLKKSNEEKLFTEEEKQAIEAMGGLEQLLKKLEELLKEQKEKHEGGNKWIGTKGTSPFGNSGYNPEGIRFGDDAKQGRAVKVWNKRLYQNLKDDVELDTRTMKMALKRLRLLTRDSHDEELDLPKTIEKTSENAGFLDIKMRSKLKNNVKILMLFDIGGSMDSYIRNCEQLFSAAKYEFKHLEYFYFHNCLYEYVWKDNIRRHDERILTTDILHKYNKDYKVIFVGDASMAPYEITHAGGSVEHTNKEAGITWLQRIKEQFTYMIWLNPTLPEYWNYTHSIKIINEFTENRMFPLTIDGLTQGMKALKDTKKKYINPA
ncbi:MAG: VWA domain-containing protein [Bacteroidetes bacterium]|nr:MAG: VWA domain-containing protein [Bacteroidota bacterium]TAG93880.1 MAG: VWA domain-containing protein [Bacteroidota bacterium]